jgi:acyl-CoA synthetase (AMP-forming)/AMP-acid ligase II
VEGTLKQVHIGSAPLSAELWNKVSKWTGAGRVWNTYGITETGSWIAGPVNDELPLHRDGYVGKGWGAEIIVAPRDTTPSNIEAFQPIADCQRGEVWLRTPDVMAGYLQRPEESAKVLQGLWFRTGDIGYIEDGQLYLVGRVRSEINKGGIKISPEEIDIVLERHPAVSEACTFGFEDNVLGEDIGTCIVLIDETVRPLELALWVSSQMSDSKIPRRWYFVNEIPKTSRGKVNRADVLTYANSIKPTELT